MRPPVTSAKNEPKRTKSRETDKKPVKRTSKKKAFKYEGSELHKLYIDYTTRRNLIINQETKSN